MSQGRSAVIELSRTIVLRSRLAMLCSPSRIEWRAAMQRLRQEVGGERRVSLIEYDGWFAVRIEVLGPEGWSDISLGVDRNLAFEVANRRYRQRIGEQQARRC